ncbi:zinc knuckle [Ostertagia ostertagi]
MQRNTSKVSSKSTPNLNRGSQTTPKGRRDPVRSSEWKQDKQREHQHCNKPGHPPKSCPEVTTLSQRLQIIRTRKLCKNCGGENHLAMRCPRGACRACGVTGHHTSICTKLFSTETPRTPQQDRATKKIPARSPSQPTAAKMNAVTSDQGLLEAEEMDTVLHVSNRADVLILAGQAQRSSLSLEDKRFLCDKDLQLSISATSTSISPQILLGCADMFTLLSNGLAPLYVLPSGLQLIPSRLGYLVAGRNHSFTETIKEGGRTVKFCMQSQTIHFHG